MPGKLFIKTHGCQMNEYDSAKMVDVLAASHGLELTANEAEADVILVNTCSIREKAQEKVFGPQTLHRLPQMIEARKSTQRAQVDISFPEIEKFDHLPEPRKEGVTA